MLAQVHSAAMVGLNAVPVTVEVDIASRGLPSFTIVGLPDKAVEESKERVRAALVNSGADFPPKRITVNLAPADLPKVGPAYDLPISVGILEASGQLQRKDKSTLVLGELSLDGTLRHTNGILLVAILAKEKKSSGLFIPEVDAGEAAMISGISVYPVVSLRELYSHLSDEHPIQPAPHIVFGSGISDAYDFDMADINGQDHAKRALEIAACGGHNVYLYGPPGAGKTMLARTLPSILPSLTEEEAIEVTKVYSVSGNLRNRTFFIRERPFRSPHHTTSAVGLIGGGSFPVPGEISLAHRGVLFLDEFPEYSRHILESLRQPLEDGFVTISRASGSVEYPSKFILVAAANPCPCGYWGSPVKRCTCLPGQVARYRKRISGPIMERIDLHIEVPFVPIEKLSGDKNKSESSKIIRERVENGRQKQKARLYRFGLFANAEMTTKVLRECVRISDSALELLKIASNRLSLSARSFYRTMKVGRTIADLESSEEVLDRHIAESLQYRPKQFIE